MDMSLYRDLFVSESRSHLAAFGELLVHLEASPGDVTAIDELFRHAHSLKGMAATMGYDQIVKLAHIMEDQLSRIRTGEWLLQPALTDLLLEGSDALTRLVERIESGSESNEDSSGLIERLTLFTPSSDTHTTNASISHGNGGILPREVTLPSQSRHTDSFKSIRIRTETLDHLVNITGELITNRYRLSEAIRLADTPDCREPLQQLTTLLRNLRDEVFKARMVPFAFIAERFPRLVRDLARSQGKEVHFHLEGKDIELDRGILEEIAEPLVHILRNAIDHGLENADDRVMAGKPFGGTLTMTVKRDKDHVEVSIADDGRGMDPELLKQAAVDKGLITSDQAARMSHQEAYQLVCKPGFSTAATITDISGRGVGMDAVRDAVHALSGVLTIQSQIGLGSSFIMRLPITVSIIHALIVQCGPCEIAVPLNIVTRTVELKHTDIHEEGGAATVTLENTSLPFRNLRHAYGLPAAPEVPGSPFPVIICHAGGTPTACGVDRIVGQQEIFVRPLRSPLSHLRGVNGATIAGDGRILFVADASALA